MTWKEVESIQQHRSRNGHSKVLGVYIPISTMSIDSEVTGAISPLLCVRDMYGDYVM